MKNILIIISSCLLITILTNCVPSDSVIQTAIASTRIVEEMEFQKTQAVFQESTQQSINQLQTEESKLYQTQTAQAFSVMQTYEAMPKECTSGNSYIDFEGDVSKNYLDIIKVDTFHEDGVLTVVMHFKSLTDDITINKYGVEKNTLEYFWGVGIDVDNDPNTGSKANRTTYGSISGIDYQLSLMHITSENIMIGKLYEGLVENATIWMWDDGNEGFYSLDGTFIDWAIDNKTITLSENIPGINDDSKLYFVAEEYIPISGIEFDHLCFD